MTALTTPISTPASQALPRSFAYNLVAATLDYPDAEFAGLVSSGRIAEQLRQAFTAVHPEMQQQVDWASLAVDDSGEELAVEYSRLFDVGASGPPCPLNAGVYLDERMQALEECVRFYNYFELTAGEQFEELPDHITTQLEFMHFLAHSQHELANAPDDAASYLRAQRDFLNRQLGKWIPKLNARVIENHARPFYLTLIGALARFIELEQRGINEMSGIIAIN